MGLQALQKKEDLHLLTVKLGSIHGVPDIRITSGTPSARKPKIKKKRY
jgi:hypothetical protein